MPPRTDGGSAEPAPKGGSADLGYQPLIENFPADVGDREASQRQAGAMRQFTSEGFYRDDETGGKAGFTPAAGFALKTGQTGQAESLAHLLTIWRGVSSREAMTSLESPSAARRMILARTTSQYGDVY